MAESSYDDAKADTVFSLRFISSLFSALKEQRYLRSYFLGMKLTLLRL